MHIFPLCILSLLSIAQPFKNYFEMKLKLIEKHIYHEIQDIYNDRNKNGDIIRGEPLL
jgi:hypothetical protein